MTSKQLSVALPAHSYVMADASGQRLWGFLPGIGELQIVSPASSIIIQILRMINGEIDLDVNYLQSNQGIIAQMHKQGMIAPLLPRERKADGHRIAAKLNWGLNPKQQQAVLLIILTSQGRLPLYQELITAFDASHATFKALLIDAGDGQLTSDTLIHSDFNWRGCHMVVWNDLLRPLPAWMAPLASRGGALFTRLELWPHKVDLVSVAANKLDLLAAYDSRATANSNMPVCEALRRRGEIAHYVRSGFCDGDLEAACTALEDHIKNLQELYPRHGTSFCGADTVSGATHHLVAASSSLIGLPALVKVQKVRNPGLRSHSDSLPSSSALLAQSYQRLLTAREPPDAQERLLASLPNLAGDVFSPIVFYRDIYTSVPMSQEEILYFAKAKYGYPTTLDMNGGLEGLERTSLGVACLPEVARLKAVCEAMERYASLIYQGQHLVFAKASKLPYGFIEPTSLHLLDEEAYLTSDGGYRPYQAHQEYHWVAAYGLHDRSIQFVPDDFVSLLSRSKSPLIRETSSGNACHTDFTTAVLKGLLEVCERDSFLTHWLLKISPVRLVLDRPPQLIAKIIESLGKMGYEVHILETQSPGMPASCMALAVALEVGRPYMALACNAALCLEEAITGALQELAATVIAINQKEYLTYTEKYQHLFAARNFYFVPQHRAHWEFLLRGPVKILALEEARQLPSSQEGLAQLMSCSNPWAYPAYVIDTSTVELRNAGLYSVKVLMPSLQPFYFDWKHRRVNWQRLAVVATHHGIGISKKINHLPHPLA